MKLFFEKITSGILLHNLYWISSLILSFIIISSVVVGSVTTFVVPNEEQFFQIPVVVQAVEEANYRDGVEQFAFPGVELAIVKEVLRDANVNSENEVSLEERISLVEEQLQQPVPEATNRPETNEEVVNNLPTPTETGNLNLPTNTLTVSPSTTTTSTNTLTATKTATFTQSATNTLIPVTGTSTRTQGPGTSSTFTLTPSVTNTSTWTPTFTGSPTWTSSVAPTFTFTATSTNSPTATFSFTPTLTFTPTHTFTPTWTSSVTPSLTHTPTFTPSLPPTFTFTPTWTNSPTPTFTFTPTMTFTPTQTFTPTLTSSVTPTFTFTSTLTPIPTLTSTFTLTPTPTATISTCNINTGGDLLKYMWPSDGSVNIPLDVIPVIVFNQSMDASTLTYGNTSHIVICQKVSPSSNSCRNGTEVNAYLEIRSVVYHNDWVIIHPLENLRKGILYTMFAGNQIIALPECASYSTPLGGRIQSTFTTVLE
jgi:hypothetical protein